MVTAAAEDVKMTRLTDFALVQAFMTFTTPWIAGLIMSFCMQKGETKYFYKTNKKLKKKIMIA